MYWKLRIPLFIFVIGAVSGIFQRYARLLFLNRSSFIASVVFISVIVILFTVLERTKINEKNVHFTVGIGLIIIGFLIDYLMV
ncbi:MAG: hypothetical protein K0Q56_1634 [Sporolactobacillus laevolacticus]|jgi:hypothetical protein|nr:hypothetical protein [Sporolactobacillus laevolacticus]